MGRTNDLSIDGLYIFQFGRAVKLFLPSLILYLDVFDLLHALLLCQLQTI